MILLPLGSVRVQSGDAMTIRIQFVVAWLAAGSVALGAEPTTDPLPQFASARLRTTRYRLPVEAMLAPSPDGKCVFALHGDTLWVMDLANGKPRRVFKGIGWSDPYRDLVLTADGKVVFSDQSAVLRVVDPETGK